MSATVPRGPRGDTGAANRHLAHLPCDGFAVPLTPCVLCGGPGEECDHRIAIAVAREIGYRTHIRAYLLRNLRWLCGPCHKQKTAAMRA